MAKYAFLLYDDETSWMQATPAEWDAAMEEHGRFTEQIAEMGGTVLGGEALEPTTTATTLRRDVVTDGPFAETKEAFGGFYVIEARDLDHALAIAKLCPIGDGCVEVRPVMLIPEG